MSGRSLRSPSRLSSVPCSTPNDLTSPTLEPQFGTADNDFGVDVAYGPSKGVYSLSETEGHSYDEDGYEEGYLDTAVLNRYSSDGKLVWSREVATGYCYYWDDCASNPLQARALVADTKGYSYTLVTDKYVTGDCTEVVSHGVYKYDAAGKFIRSVYLGNSGEPFGGATGAAFSDVADLAVDGSSNLYIVRQNIDFDDDYCDGERTNVIAKYSAKGALQWQRTSSVGTLYGISLSSNGNVYVAGSTGVAKYTNSGNLSWTKSGAADGIATPGTNTVYARYRTAIRKLDANGKQLWSKTQTGLNGIVVGDMTADAKANVYLTGKYSASSRNRDVFTRKLSYSGKTLFTKTFGTSVYDDARGIATLNGSEIYITGETQGSLVPPYRGGGNDGYVRKLSSSGNPVWTR